MKEMKDKKAKEYESHLTETKNKKLKELEEKKILTQK